MSLDQRLTDAASRFVEGLTAPVVDVDAVRRQARAKRRRAVSLIAVAAVVSAVVAFATVLGVERDSSAPAPVDPGPSPRVSSGAPVWYDAAGLNGPDPAGGGRGVLALVRGGALYLDPATGDVWFHPWDAEPRVVGRGSQTGPGGDPEGDVAAWFEGDELVVYDTARGSEISRTEEAPVVPSAGTEHVIDASGFLHASSKEVVWRP